MSDNPYRFTVDVIDGDGVWYVDVLLREVSSEDVELYSSVGFDTEAEANEHAELIRQAMREVS
jgi:hypothetical protein